MNMLQMDYAPTGETLGVPIAVSVFSDQPQVRDEIAGDAAGAGFQVHRSGAVSDLLQGEPLALGDIVLLDCPQIDAATMAALSQLDMRILRAGARLIVSTRLQSLEGVFACLDQCEPRILVSPTRGERVIALGHELTNIDTVRVREPSQQEQVTLLRLSEQVSDLARKLDTLTQEGGEFTLPVHRLEAAGSDYRGGEPDDALFGGPRPPLPDPRLVRKLIRQRQARARFFEGDLFADPAWDILLDLTAARAENERVSVTSLCIASGVPPTTALRWISQMTSAGLLERVEDEQDKRRAFIALSDAAADAMARYFAEIGTDYSPSF